MDLYTFFNTFGGQAVTAIGLCLSMALIYMLAPKGESLPKLRTLAISALFIAAAFASNNFLPHISMPQGGSVTLFSMLLLYIPAYLFGPRVGMLAGISYGFLDLLIKPYAYFPLQVLLDYPIAFGMLGIGGFFKKEKSRYFYGFAAGVIGRFAASFLSGFIFFASYAPEGFSPVLWSAYYNGAYMGAELALSLLVMPLPPLRSALSKMHSRYGL
ncbi:MAG: energy-coupled thiamine transporter ThiT [Eubacteriaceae bacterium]|nr:energy-coupled thiamine transporter ThiT [Eubacteriaceae bacterium]